MNTLFKVAYQGYKPPRQAPDSKSLNKKFQKSTVPSTSNLAKKSMMKKTALFKVAAEEEKKKPSFVQRHKKKLIGGAAVLGAGAFVGLASRKHKPSVPKPTTAASGKPKFVDAIHSGANKLQSTIDSHVDKLKNKEHAVKTNLANLKSVKSGRLEPVG